MINAVSPPSVGAPTPSNSPTPTAAPASPPPVTPVPPPTATTLPPFQPAKTTIPPQQSGQNNPPPTPPDSQPPTPKKKGFPIKGVIAILVLLLTIIGGGATYYLTQTSQDIRQQASEGDYGCTPWTVTCVNGKTATEADCSVQKSFDGTFNGDGYNNWKIEHCASVGSTPVGSENTTTCDPASAFPGQTKPITRCDEHVCPNGDTDGDGQCTADDNGHKIQACGTGGCWGQKDYYSGDGTDPICYWELFGSTKSCNSNPGGGENPSPSNEKIVPTVACATAGVHQAGVDQADFNWPVKAGADRYILRIDKQNSCQNDKGETIGWFCGTNEGFPNNTGDQYYLLSAADTNICSGSSCQVSKPIVSNSDYVNASIQWLNPGDSTDADGARMGYSSSFNLNCGTSVGACSQLTMTPTTPKFGDTVNLTCAPVAGATSYSFTITEPGQSPRVIESNGNKASFQAVYTGNYQARCEVN